MSSLRTRKPLHAAPSHTVHDLAEAARLRARLCDLYTNSRRYREHLRAAASDDLAVAAWHLVAAFAIAARYHEVDARDWRRWKLEIAQRRHRLHALEAAAAHAERAAVDAQRAADRARREARAATAAKFADMQARAVAEAQRMRDEAARRRKQP